MKRLLVSLFDRLIRSGRLTVTWPDGSTTIHAGDPGPTASVRIRDWATVRHLGLHPGMAFGEGYMDGSIELAPGSTIFATLDLLLSNIEAGLRHPALAWRQVIQCATRRFRQINDADRARRHAAHHYDIDSRVYSFFLDADQQYSCAYFPNGDETLEEAQLKKKRHIATKLHLHRPDLTVLDIGCGWGGMAITLAREYGARVLGITLSTEQLALARARAEAAGLQDRVEFELADYRSIARRFDRIVSVGMMEHVGVPNFPSFFNTVRGNLHDDGAALIHHIGRSDGPGCTAPWLQKYIFPGGYAPALSEVLPAIEKSGLLLTDVETWVLHYARTIELWRERFARHRDEIRDLHDERFCRMFEFYLAGAELAFRRERQVVYQLQLTPSQTALPPSRSLWANAARERELAA